MAELWFWLSAILVAAWATLDGFDLGAGVLHHIVAKTDTERREVFGAIGPVWDGNEVCLLAAGGTLFLAFPKVLAAGFSGLYLPMMFVLWAVILRGISIEFRSHLTSPLWRSFWDTTFTASSAALPVLTGAALGNVLRGVPLGADGYFEIQLFSFSGEPGVLDGYTILLGVFALATLSAHASLFLWWKTKGEVSRRSRSLAPKLWGLVVVLWLFSLLATSRVNPSLLSSLPGRPLGWLSFAISIGGLALVFFGLQKQRELLAFLGSCALIVGMLATAAACAYPVMLPSTINASYSLTAENSASLALGTGLSWWFPALLLVIGYFIYIFRTYRGKVEVPKDGPGY